MFIVSRPQCTQTRGAFSQMTNRRPSQAKQADVAFERIKLNMLSFQFQTGEQLMTAACLQSDCVTLLLLLAPVGNNDIALTLKPSFCRQRASRRAPSLASSSLSRGSAGGGRERDTTWTLIKTLTRAANFYFPGKVPSPRVSVGLLDASCLPCSSSADDFPRGPNGGCYLGLAELHQDFLKQGNKQCS